MDMPDLFYIIEKWWKKILLFAIVATTLVAILLFLQPRLYLSEATALRASSYTTDKASIFNRNIEALYSTLGSADDLDMIIGTAQLDTVYLYQVDSFELVTHYSIDGKPEQARRKAAARLQKNSKVMKSGYGELKVKVWDRDRVLAAQLANSIMDRLHSIHQGLLNESNVSTLTGLQTRYRQLQERHDTATADRKQSLLKQLESYENLIGEYELMVETKQPALLIVEHARPSLKIDKPRFIPILAATLFLSLVFGFFLAIILERKKQTIA